MDERKKIRNLCITCRYSAVHNVVNAESPYRLLLQPTVMMRKKLNENEFATKLTHRIKCAQPEGKV